MVTHTMKQEAENELHEKIKVDDLAEKITTEAYRKRGEIIWIEWAKKDEIRLHGIIITELRVNRPRKGF